MKIASWNVNSLRVRLPHVLDWLKLATPHVLALQETKVIDEEFPIEAVREAGYHAVYSGQKTYNGVALLCCQPPDEVERLPSGIDTTQKRTLAATVRGVRIINLYVINGGEVGSDKYAAKLEWLQHVTAWIKRELRRYRQTVIVGDFNITPADEDVYDPALWQGKILCSKPERDALKQMMGLGLTDTFRLFRQPPKTFSWWDYRGGAYRRNEGMRIDLILASGVLTRKCKQAYIDREPRVWERPSDHVPVVAEFSAETALV